MSMQNKQNLSGGRNAQGFSLVELLVVIAVIAILAAIIFPVFFSAQERSRQATVLSNYRKISDALAKYQLDNGRPPKVLFGYADTAASMEAVRILVPGSQPHYDGLYPNYINDVSVFQDPNNNVLSNVKTGNLKTNKLDADGVTLVPDQHMFFAADAVDVSPLVTANNTIDTNTLVPRYQPAWTSVVDPAGPTYPGGLTAAVYRRQLIFGNNADGGAYVTCDTYHVTKQNKILVLFKDGSAKPIDASKLLAGGGDKADITVSTDVSPATFWKYAANGF